MKKLFIIGAVIILISCSKTKTFMNTGVITGSDPRTCACCGGYFFHFTDVPDTTNKLIVNPEIFQLSNSVKYPVNVQIDWQKTTVCSGSAIKIINFNLLQ